MKTILVATDFSVASDHAALYAIDLAEAINASVVLFHAYQLPTPSVEASIIIPAEEIANYAQKRLDDQANMVRIASDSNIETLCEEGYPVEAILKTARDRNADVIITGMKEHGKGFRKLFGSTVTSLAEVTTIPLLAVPQKATYKQPMHIALATESDVTSHADKHFLDALREIAEKFKSKIYLVRVAHNHYKQQYELFNYPVRLAEMIEPFNSSYKTIQGQHLASTLNKFIKDFDIHMLVMLPHQHSFIEKLFAKSSTRSMIFDSRIPVLVLPEIQKEIGNRTHKPAAIDAATGTTN